MECAQGDVREMSAFGGPTGVNAHPAFYHQPRPELPQARSASHGALERSSLFLRVPVVRVEHWLLLVIVPCFLSPLQRKTGLACLVTLHGICSVPVQVPGKVSSMCHASSWLKHYTCFHRRSPSGVGALGFVKVPAGWRKRTGVSFALCTVPPICL